MQRGMTSCRVCLLQEPGLSDARLRLFFTMAAFASMFAYMILTYFEVK